MLPVHGVWVRSLVREIISLMLCGMTKKKNKVQEKYLKD